MNWGRRQDNESPMLIQEESGIHVGISADLAETARHAASVMNNHYQQWLQQNRFAAWGNYKQHHFTIAVGGGNTLKAEYQSWLEQHHRDIDWIKHVRFFFLEESSGEKNWESAETSLIVNFIVPLARKLIKTRGINAIATTLKLERPVDEDDIIDAMITRMIHSINLAEVTLALESKKRPLALKLAQAECKRYQGDIENKLGGSMAFHFIVSGIGKDGSIGGFSPYTPELEIKEPAAIVLKQDKGALRVALNRGVFTHAECVSLIVSGNLKLKALGRFEMEEAADFEQTVRETPLRMLRESYDIAEKVYIFADEQALHFDERAFEYIENGQTIQIKAETREGDEKNGIHVLLMHGFMGLFSFTNFLIRLPSAWTVSALHRGSHAKHLPNDEIFRHYARSLRKAILKNWRQGRPAPIAGHSIAGIISDHLLLSIIPDYDAPIPSYEELKSEDRQLVDALRASGIIHLASWAPTDGPNTGQNIKAVISHYRSNTALDFSGYNHIYTKQKDGQLEPAHAKALADSASNLAGLDRFLDKKIARPLISGMNLGLRRLLNNKTVQRRMLNSSSPYVLRLVGGRLLKTASLYGLAKEVNAALHSPVEYQRRHLQALEILLQYDIPFLSIVHEDDFLVSAIRHREEHDYLLAHRLRKEGVKREQDLEIPARYIALKRETSELAMDPLNPHLMIMATSTEGNSMARQITAAMTRFVNENAARAVKSKTIKPLDSVARWLRKNKSTPIKSSTGRKRPTK